MGHFFEYLQCPLQAADLQMVRKRWLASGRGSASLLSAQDDCEGADRIVEALECHTWKDLEWKDSSKDSEQRHLDSEDGGASQNGSKTADAPLASRSHATDGANGAPRRDENEAEHGNERAVEDFEQFVEDIRKVREMPDDASRRDRAAEVALRVAKSFGLDYESDEDF